MSVFRKGAVREKLRGVTASTGVSSRVSSIPHCDTIPYFVATLLRGTHVYRVCLIAERGAGLMDRVRDPFAAGFCDRSRFHRRGIHR